MTTCRVCRSISGETPIAPAPAIYDGRYWSLQHAYPSKLAGWLVIVLKRHAEALHELSGEELLELGVIQAGAVRALRSVLGCAKEYIACFAEQEGFAHLHVHVIPRAHDLSDDLKGGRIFAMLQATPEQAIQPDEVRAICQRLRAAYAAANP